MNTDISERINHLIAMKGISKKTFAEQTGLSQPIVSHITGGRNQPGLDVLQKILNTYPDLSPEWLILGKGDPERSDQSVSIKKELKNLHAKLSKLQTELQQLSAELSELTNP